MSSDLKNRSLLPNPRLTLLLTLALPLAALAQDEFFEILPDGNRPPLVSGSTEAEPKFAGASRQSAGALTGRVVFTSGGHGWTWGREGWFTQRGVGQEMNEDYGNLDQMNFFVPYAFNSGATVVAFRPIGYQTNEVVLDNDSPGVKFSGKWINSRSTVYYGRPGAVPYRFALLDKTETAKAAYTPKIPVAGFYPVYAWARHGPDRTSQLYRILHTGGQTLVRVPYHMVGNGWVFLGIYYFDAGADRKRGSVIASNLQPTPGFGAVAIADAIRFGNGMGDIVPASGGRVSTYPREEEASRYWILKGLGQGQTNVISASSTDQQASNVGAPPRAARAMNRESEGNLLKRVFVSFHSNAGGGRGTIGLWNNPKLFPGTDTPHQERLAELLGSEVTHAFTAMSVPPLELPWFKRSVSAYARTDYAFGEINNKSISNEFDATIVEVAFHDSKDDAKLLRDPKVRDLVGRCAWQGIIRYLNEFDGLPLQFLPDPPRNPRATTGPESVSIVWEPPADSDRNPVESYVIWRSENGYGFGHPVRVPASKTSLALADLPRGKDVYFRVTAVNPAGESLPSLVVGCRRARTKDAPRVLFVNGYSQFDRFNNPRQTIKAESYTPPSGSGKMDRLIPRLNNAFDYVVQHGKALAAAGAAFDSCQREAVASGLIRLEQYEAVIWAAGKQTANLLDSGEEKALTRYLQHGGNVFLTGAHIEGALLGSNAGSANSNLGQQLHAKASDSVSNAPPTFSFAPSIASAFRREKPGVFGEGRDQCYFVSTASRLLPDGSGAQIALHYPESASAAAIQYDGSGGGGKAVCFGFPFESISAAKARSRYLADVLRFFAFGSSPRQILQTEITRAEHGAQIEWRAFPNRKYQLQFNTVPESVLWQNLGRPVVASGFSLTQWDRINPSSTHYRVLVIN
jgi:hypothetical protein